MSANNGNGKSGEDETWKWTDALFQEEASPDLPRHQQRLQKEHHHSLDLPAANLDPLFANTKDFGSPEFWMSGEGDAWLDQMDNLVGILEMDHAALRIPMQRITRRSGGKSLLVLQTKRDTSGRKVDGRIRILKNGRTEGNPRIPNDIPRILRILSRSMKRSESAEIPFNMADTDQKKRSNPVRLTRLLNIQKALRILSRSLQ